MRQKTKNHQNQGSIDKKFDFFPQSLSHMPRWVHLVQKTRAKNSHAWAPLRKLCRVPPFPLKICLLISKMKQNWIRFAYVSLVHLKNSVLFFRFFSLPNFRFASINLFSLRSETKGKPFLRFKSNNSSTLIHIFKLVHVHT
jgi:hypothetical protein